MEKFYIGSRLGHWEISNILDGSAPCLNSRLSENIRSVALRKGIAKTQKGKQLKFYSVNKEQLDVLTAPYSASFIALKHSVDWHPLIVVDCNLMHEILNRVNAKYSRRIDYSTFKAYTAELNEALDKCVIKINEDKKVPRKTKLRN